MTLYRKRLTSCLFAMLALLAQAAVAQTYPSKPVRFVVGFAPGGPNDILARIVGQKLSEGLGVQVLVDNRPGADSMIGTRMAARATPDGYTIAMISASATIHPSVYNNVPYDVMKDFSTSRSSQLTGADGEPCQRGIGEVGPGCAGCQACARNAAVIANPSRNTNRGECNG